MNNKIRVGIIFGGKSAEHEVSLQSAKNVIETINKDKYDVILIGIDKKGKWYLNDSLKYLLNETDPKLIGLNKSEKKVTLIPSSDKAKLINLSNNNSQIKLDVVFPIMHGTYGEDGTIQGMLKLLDIPYVGAGVLGSAVGMDKDVMKRLLRDANIPIAKFVVLRKYELTKIDFQTVKNKLGLPFFVKPANLGSSVGVSKVKNKDEFEKAIKNAFEYDNKILIEEYIKGREIECSVLGNENPVASLPGEVIPKHEFYSYEAKYIDENGSSLQIPAKLDKNVMKNIQQTAVKAFEVLCCEGMARVDFFLKENGDVYVNEINTIPGFTKISMYPKLWEISGISYSKLIDKLIQLALERYEKEKKLKTSVEIK